MTGMGAEPRQPLWARVKDYLEFAAVLMGAVTVVASGVLWLGGEKLRYEAQASLGIHQLGDRIDVLAVVGRENGKAIAALTPAPVVAEYDRLRSRVYSPCEHGRVCEYQMRARRTDFGEQCRKPDVLGHTVIDRSGLFHQAFPTKSGRVSRLTGEWAVIHSAFIPPDEASAGVAEYVMRLGYDCGAAGYIEEDTIALVFEIIPAQAP